jgi:hypothetical protein
VKFLSSRRSLASTPLVEVNKVIVDPRSRQHGLMPVAAGAITNSTVDSTKSVIDEVAGVESRLDIANTKSHGWSYTRSPRRVTINKSCVVSASIYLQSWHV